MPILTSEERLGQLILARYRLDAVLGTGGMGVLFRGFDHETGQSVAVKMVKPADSIEPERIARFLRETRIAAMLRHPHVAKVLDSGCDETGSPFLVMELLDGRSLEQELTGEAVLSFSETLAIAVPIANALAAAHRLGVIHRDIKPSNIFLCGNDTGAVVPKLIDFGIARSPTDDFETRTGLLVGTPGYIAPEQARDGECGPFTDVWGVGAVVYRCLTGKPPHSASSVPEMLARLVREPVQPLVAKGVRKSACATIDRALERDPQRRYPSMEAFARALEAAALPECDDRATDEIPVFSAATVEVPPDVVGGEASVAPRVTGAKSWRHVRRIPGLAALAVLGLFATGFPRSTHTESAGAVLARETPKPEGVPNAPLFPAPSDPSEKVEPQPVRRAAPAPTIPFERPSAKSASPNPRARPPIATRAPVSPPRSLASPSASEPERERNTGLPVAVEW